MTSTLPPGSRVAVWPSRAMPMLPVADHVPVFGSYSSAEFGLRSAPPATSTLPSGSSVAVWLARAEAMLPAADHVPVPGSYNSAADRRPVNVLKPPATSTLPLGSGVAVW
ncbi:hypothetical protein WI83_20815 [Burkholderia ubonensis]|nr:hypothetical protein WI83_20815 [Burkholderia ubonensis]